MSDNIKKVGRPKGEAKSRKPIKRDQYLFFMDEVKKSNMVESKKCLVRGVAVLLRYGGFRVSELVNLRVSDLSTLRQIGVISLTNTTKTKKPRDAHFGDDSIKEILKVFSCLDKSDEHALLFHGRGNIYDKRNPASYLPGL